MQTMLSLALLTLPIAGMAGALPQEAAAPPASGPAIRWDAEPFLGGYQTRQGPAELEGRLGRITVPEDHADPKGATIELAFVHYASENPKPGPPMIYLVGGPGGSGTEYGAFFGKHPLLPVLEYCDVIALDQRGTGLSQPNLGEGPDLSYELPLDQPLTIEQEEIAFAAAVRRGMEYWKQEGVGLEHFNTAQSAEDIESLRRALGLESISLWGGSYGSHLGLAYLRQYSEHVDFAILTKVEGPDHSYKLPSTVQRHLAQLSETVAADPNLGEGMPDLLGSVKALLDQLAAEPVSVEVPGEDGSTSVVVGPFDLQRAIAGALGNIREYSTLPASIQRASQGDWSELGASALESRRSEVWSMMSIMMDCASGASPKRWERLIAESQEPQNLLGNAINAPFGARVAEAAGNPQLGPDFLAPIESEVKVLFVTGDLDVRTPPENVEEIRGGFPNHVWIQVEGVCHDSFEMLSPDYQAVMRAFLAGETVESQTITITEMRFQPLGE